MVFGLAGTRDAAEPRDRVRHGEHRVDQAERAVAVAAGSVEGDAVALGADAAGDDAVHVRTVHGDEGADPVLVVALLEQMPHAAQVAWPFLADIGDEQEIGAGAMPAASIARIQASSTARERVSSPTPGANSLVPSRRTVTSVPAGNTVSRCAATQISGPLPTPGRRPVTLPSASIARSLSPCAAAIDQEGAGAGFLLERRRGDLGQRDDVVDRPVMLGGQGGDARCERPRWP